MDALAFGIGRRRINWVLDRDVKSFFDKLSQPWLIRFIEHRIGDRRIIRLIAKWLTVGVLEGGHLIVTEEGTPQGAVISPVLATSISTTSRFMGPPVEAAMGHGRRHGAEAGPSSAAGPAGCDREPGFGSSRRAKHDGVGRWIDIEADDVAQLVDELRSLEP